MRAHACGVMLIAIHTYISIIYLIVIDECRAPSDKRRVSSLESRISAEERRETEEMDEKKKKKNNKKR